MPRSAAAAAPALKYSSASARLGPGTRTAALHGALRNAEDARGLGNGVALHVDRHHGCTLLDGKPHQGAFHHDRGVHPRRGIADVAGIVLELRGGVCLVAPQPVEARVHDDAVQPAADRGVVAEGGGAAVRRQHRILQGISGVLGIAAGDPRQPVQLAVVTVEQLFERVPVTGDVCRQQFGVSPIDSPAAPHSRTLNGAAGGS